MRAKDRIVLSLYSSLKSRIVGNIIELITKKANVKIVSLNLNSELISPEVDGVRLFWDGIRAKALKSTSETEYLNVDDAVSCLRSSILLDWFECHLLRDVDPESTPWNEDARIFEEGHRQCKNSLAEIYVFDSSELVVIPSAAFEITEEEIRKIGVITGNGGYGSVRPLPW